VCAWVPPTSFLKIKKKNVSCSAGPVSFAYVKHGAADYVIVLYVDPSTATSLQKAKSSVHKRAVAGHLVVRCCFFGLPWYRLKGTFSVPPRHPRDRVQGRSDRGQPRQGHQHNRPAQAGRRPSQWWVEGVHIRVIRSYRCRGRRGQCFGASGSSPPCTSAGEGRFQRKSQRELIGSFIRRREEQGGQGQAGGRGEGQEGRRS